MRQKKIGPNKSSVYAENNFPIIQAVPWLISELVCACANALSANKNCLGLEIGLFIHHSKWKHLDD